LQDKSEGSAMYRLYGFFTQNSMKPLYVLEESGVDFEFHFVDLSKGENRSDEFKRKTAVGKVPVLEHKGEYVFESGAICRYVANNENSPLYPQNPMQRAKVDQWLDYFTCHLGRWLNTLYWENIIKPKVGLGETNAEACEEALNFAVSQSAMLDGQLAGVDYMANNTLSIADLCAFAYVEQCDAVGFSLDDYPNVKAWFERMESRESIGRARAKLPS